MFQQHKNHKPIYYFNIYVTIGLCVIPKDLTPPVAIDVPFEPHDVTRCTQRGEVLVMDHNYWLYFILAPIPCCVLSFRPNKF